MIVADGQAGSDAGSVPSLHHGGGEAGALNILLVEDNPGDVRLVGEALRPDRARLGDGPHLAISPRLTISHVDTLARALAHLESHPVDVVLLDLSLPDSHGTATLERMQRLCSSTPIVVLTGHDEPGVAETVLEHGAQDFIAKRDLPDFPVARAVSWAISRMHAQIERAALIERLASEQERLMEDLRHARQMQLALLPRADRLGEALARLGLSLESRFEPSSAIGGDLWGAFDLGGGRLAVYTFDFSGHGISAALNVFRLHTLLDDHDRLRADPARLLADLNDSLAGLLGPGQFATMFYAVIDTVVGEMRWSAAGAPRPLLVGGGRTVFLDTCGIPLGIGPGVAYRDRSVAFPVGTGLLLFSDAVSEAVDERGEFLGEEGVAALAEDTLRLDARLTLDRLFPRFLERVRSPLGDDLTLLWISRATDHFPC